MKLSRLPVERPVPFFVFMVVCLVMGAFSYINIPRESSPDIQIPILIVAIPFPGASPEDVESLITYKVETEFQGLENLKKLSSTSAEGVSTFTLEYYPNFDIDEARTKTREALDKVKGELPDDAEDPIIQEINLSETPLLYINLAASMDLSKLKDIAEDLKESIESIPGILEVRRVGGVEREIRVYINPERLFHYQIDINQVTRAIRSSNVTLPGGDLELGPNKYLIRIPGNFKTPQDVENALVWTSGEVPIFVKDIGRVVYGFKEVTSLSRLNGQDSISLNIIKRTGENLLAVRKNIQAKVDLFEGQYHDQVKFQILADQAKHVERFSRELENNIIMGSLLVFLILLVVMGLRNAMFVAAAIPFSFLISIVILEMMGFTLNMMVLFSLVLSLGMLVDDAIVVVENIYRHLQTGLSRKEAAIRGVQEVWWPVITSTLTTIAAFAPLAFMPGIVGQFMSFLPKTITIALSASLLVGLFLNPVLCSTMMKIPKKIVPLSHDDHVRDTWGTRLYRPFLRIALRFRLSSLVLVALAFVGIIFWYANTALKEKGVEFFPTSEPEQATINIKAPAGTTLAVSDQYVHQIETILEPYRENTVALVANVGQRSGSGAEDAGGTTSFLSHILLEFPEWEHWKMKPSEMLEAIRPELAKLVGVEVLISKQQGGPPTGPPVNIEIRGEDLNELKEISQRVQSTIKNTEGLVDLRDNFDQSRSEIKIDIDREKAGRFGLTTQDIAMTVRTAFNGMEASTFRDGKDEYSIVVQLDDPFRKEVNDLDTLYVQSRTGIFVPLKEIASVSTGPSFGTIHHIDRERVLTVSANAEGVAGPVLLAKVKEQLTELDLPQGYSIRYTGEDEDRQESQLFLVKSFFVTIFLIFLIVTCQFNSLRTPLIILSSVLLSLMGVFLGLIIHNAPFSVIMTGIGVVSLAGIVVKNAIVMIDFIQVLEKTGLPRDEAILQAGLVRLRPVMLTAIATVLGLVPIAMGMDINFFRWPIVVFGAESSTMWKPMSYAIIYGLAVSTILTLIVVPVLYSLTDAIYLRIRGLFRGKKSVEI